MTPIAPPPIASHRLWLRRACFSRSAARSAVRASIFCWNLAAASAPPLSRPLLAPREAPRAPRVGVRRVVFWFLPPRAPRPPLLELVHRRARVQPRLAEVFSQHEIF